MLLFSQKQCLRAIYYSTLHDSILFSAVTKLVWADERHPCMSCLFTESAGVWHGVRGSLHKEAGAKLAWLRFSEFLTHGS